MHQRSYYDSVLAIEMKNKIPSLSSTMMLISDYYGTQVYFFFAMLVSLYDVISCDVINVKNFSSNINEVIRSVLNFFFFFTKTFHKYKRAQNRLQRTKIRNVYKKHLSSKTNEVIKFFNQFRLDNLVF